MKELDVDKDVFSKISVLVEKARNKIASTINEEMIILYWKIGKVIKEDKIKLDRAGYGKQGVQSLSDRLTRKFGKGFSKLAPLHAPPFFIPIHPLLVLAGV